MAVFFDLEEDDDHQSHTPRLEGGRLVFPSTITSKTSTARMRPHPSIIVPTKHEQQNNKMAAAITCYPVALSLASHLDLNDLDALAATCRIVQQSLRQYARQLKSRSLRCVYDDLPTSEMLVARMEDWPMEELVIDASIYVGSQLPRSGLQTATPAGIQRSIGSDALSQPLRPCTKTSSCARDLVSSCRQCGVVVCRNCTTKPSTNAWLKDRYRRLCKTCLDAPFEAHLQPFPSLGDKGDGILGSSASSVKSERSSSSSSPTSGHDHMQDAEIFPNFQTSLIAPAFLRGPCTCASRGVFLCMQCGQNLRAADTTYQRVWTWRSRYSTHIGGGLGTGLGQGNQGQKCGRGEECLERSADAVCWVEIDCAEGTSRNLQRDQDASSSSHGKAPGYKNTKPGYFQQEIEGIGGVVKKKVRKRMKVGATVWEYEDERASGKYLEREAKGILRSWCGWCGRVCPGPDDMTDSLNLLAT